MMRDDRTHDPEEILHDEILLTQTQGGVAPNRTLSEPFQYAMVMTGSGKASMTPEISDWSKRSSYDTEVGHYRMADTVMPGVDAIPEYDPARNKGQALLEARMANSGTLSGEQLDNLGHVSRTDPRVLKQQKADFAKSTEVARKAAVSMRKPNAEINFGTIWNLMSSLNATANKGATGGKLRGTKIQAGRVRGTDAAQLPETVFATFSTIADQIKAIKATQDRNLQKSQAIKLASFAYQMTLSEHMFSDGNGRSARLLADTILQTFGLPPHTPLEEEKHIVKSLGEREGMDFDRGAQVFLRGVQQSSQTLAPPAPAPAPVPAQNTDAAGAPQGQRRQGFFSWLGSKIARFFGFGRRNASA